MKIQKVLIQNFRSIQKQEFNSKELSILIGDNGTAKTSVIEAINYCLSPYFLSGRLKHTDFYNGTDDSILIQIDFDECFTANLPDGYTKQQVNCQGIFLEIKKRDKASPGKAFSDLVVITHYAIPNRSKDNEKGWEITRKSGKKFQFDERLLSLSQVELENIPKSFYFGKNRERQLQKGFNSSISSVFDDFNWRFLKGLRKETVNGDQENFFDRKTKLESEIIEKVDEASVKKSFSALNNKLKDFNIDTITLSFIDGNAPFETAFISQKTGNLDLSISQVGSGIEMIVSLLFLETLASLSKEQIIVMIDEPELHLHPSLQEKFIRYLIEFSKTNQIFFSTHSPYFFKNCLNNQNIELLVTIKEDDNIVIENTGNQFGLFPWSPSWGEINYYAYDLPTIEFHNELYGYLQEITQNFNTVNIENYFRQKSITKTKDWARIQNGQIQQPESVTLMTYIRHSIHHPENTNNQAFTNSELKQSIDELIKLVKNP